MQKLPGTFQPASGWRHVLLGGMSNLSLSEAQRTVTDDFVAR
jgi:hypothetical protein